MCEGVELMTASARRTASTHIHSARVYSWVVRYCASTHDTEAAVTHAPEGIEESGRNRCSRFEAETTRVYCQLWAVGPCLEVPKRRCVIGRNRED